MTTDGDGTGDGIEGGSGSRPGDEGLASAGWIAGSIVSLLIGWSLALASILSTSGPSSSRWSGGGMLLLDAIAAALGLGVPILCLVSMRRAERRGSTVVARRSSMRARR